MAQNYGLTAAGFSPKQQNIIITEINTLLQGIFGPNANLAPEAVLGQLVGVFSEREALLWQLLEAIYDSQYPGGAEGTSVDNILALNNLRRLPATATKTAPTSTTGIPGLIFYGTPGTIIPINSIISVAGSPSTQFQTDAAYTIAAATKETQVLSTYGGVPTSGSFSLSIIVPPLLDPAAPTLTTEVLSYNANDTTSQIGFSAAPSGATYFTLGLTLAGALLTTGNITCASTYPTAAAIQVAIRALSGYSAVVVTGSAGAYTVAWGTMAEPVMSVVTNTTGVTISITDSIQAAINNLYDATVNEYPYTDVSVIGTFTPAPSGFAIVFGANAVVPGQPSSGGQSQNTFSVATNSLYNASGFLGLNCVTTIPYQSASVIGSATCIQKGPIFVAANYLTTIGSSITGWASVDNPLDCITGTNVETDTEALTRRATLLAENANGPLQSIVEKVSQVPGVVQAVGYENTSLAAQQIISFSPQPFSGTFKLTISNPIGTQTTGAIAWDAQATTQVVNFSAVPSAGTWTLTLGVTTIPSIPYNITAATLQTLIRSAVPGYALAIVTGGFNAFPLPIFTIGNGANPLLALIVNSSGLTGATATVVDSIQAKVNALVGYSQAIVSGSISGGAITIIFNGSNGGQPQSLFTFSNSLGNSCVMSVVYGIPGKAFFILVSDNNGEASNASIAQAIFGAKPGGILAYSSGILPAVIVQVEDAYGNYYQIGFSRPNQVLVYVSLALITDLATSSNPQFQPGSITTIQDDIVNIGSAFGVGGVIVGFGTNGLIGAFNSVPGITGYTLNFGLTPGPTNDVNIPLLSTQVGQFETYLVQITYQ